MKTKKHILAIILCVFVITNLLSQVAINTDGTNPDNSAMLDIKSTNKGILIPRMTQAQRNAISLPATGLMIYQTDATPGFYYWNGSSWIAASGAKKIDDLTDGRYTGFSVFLGVGAGQNDVGSNNYNTGVGYQALTSNTTGYSNTANGALTLSSNTTGAHNTANGAGSLYLNTTGNFNTANGFNTLASNTTGNYNTASGANALTSNGTGINNTATGSYALLFNTIGSNNTANGANALQDNRVGYNNTANGFQALAYNYTGNNNTANGFRTLYNNITGYNNTALGYQAFNIGNYYNSTALGSNTAISASNQVRLGNSVVTSIGGYTNWTNVSDVRFKTDVQENVPGLAFIKKLRPVTYHLDMDAIAKYNKTPDSLRLKSDERQKAAILQTGFIAQEVEQAAQSLGYDFSGVDTPKNDNDHYGLRYAEFVVPLVKAIQEQQQIIEQQQKEINELKTLVKDLSRSKH